MAAIHRLPDELVGKIAAGEVVERPASVVKELLENALDAGAATIQVELVAGGTGRIVVRDDGRGMDAADARLAFERHATSKIAAAEDLERIASLGFRGEALSSIAAVARVELATAATDGEGRRVRVEGGEVTGDEPAGLPRGTRVEVDSLFYNVPARRKFLKTPRTELRRSVEVVQSYALARPEVAFELRHEGRLALRAPAATADEAGVVERVRQIFGSDLADHLVPLRDAEGGGGGARVEGLVGDPTTTRGRRLFTWVNRRAIRDRAVMARFYRAVRAEWKAEEFPALFLFLSLPLDEVDVNVHPQKAEVRFRDPSLLDRLSRVLRDALARARGEEPAPLATPGDRPRAPLGWRPWSPERGDEVAEPGAGSPSAAPPGQELPAGPRLPGVDYAPSAPSPVPLSGRSGEGRPFRLLGQYKATLLLLEGPDGLYLIDQHVAHERILYERFRRDLEKRETPSQRLVEPRVLELSPAEALRLAELAEELSTAGFDVAALSGHSVALSAVPAALSAEEARGVLLELARDPEEAGEGEEGVAQRLLEAMAASRACRAAVKMHHPLGREEMLALVEELFEAEHPYACPHGRPVVLRLGDLELEKRFGRR